MDENIEPPKILIKKATCLYGDSDRIEIDDEPNSVDDRLPQLFISKTEKSDYNYEPKEEINDHLDITRTESFSQTKRYNFEIKKMSQTNKNLEISEIIDSKKKKEKIKNGRKSSSLIKYVYSLEIELKRKFFLFFKSFLVPHLMVDILLIGVSFSHTFYNSFCYMKPLCSCDNDLKIKVYTAFIFLNEYGSLAFGQYISVVSIFIANNRKLNRIVHFFHLSICVSFTFLYIIWSSEDQRHNEWAIDIIIFSTTSFFLGIVTLFKYKTDFKEIWKNLSKTSIVTCVLMGHYILIRLVFPKINQNLPDYLAPYIIPFYQLVYFRIISTIFLKVIQIYYDFINSLSKSISPIVLNLQIRFFQTFLLSVPVTSIINLSFDKQHFLKWVFLISYANCLILNFTRVDLMSNYLFNPIYNRIFRFYRNQDAVQTPIIPAENEIRCSHLISGNLLDMIYIINARLIMWVALKTWATRPTNISFYKNCSFEMDFSFFQINELGIISIIVVNISITLAIFAYMKKKQVMLFEYKTYGCIDDKIVNVMGLYFFALFFDLNIQVSYSLK